MCFFNDRDCNTRRLLLLVLALVLSLLLSSLLLLLLSEFDWNTFGS